MRQGGRINTRGTGRNRTLVDARDQDRGQGAGHRGAAQAGGSGGLRGPSDDLAAPQPADGEPGAHAGPTHSDLTPPGAAPLIHPSAWRDCLERARSLLNNGSVEQEVARFGVLCPLLAALRDPIWRPLRFSKPCRKGRSPSATSRIPHDTFWLCSAFCQFLGRSRSAVMPYFAKVGFATPPPTSLSMDVPRTWGWRR